MCDEIDDYDLEKLLTSYGVESADFRLVIGRTRIDYDPEKEATNRRKHEYSLESAAVHLQRILLPTDACTPYIGPYSICVRGEVRHLHMALGDTGKVVFFVTTMRPHEVIRVISYREASEREREIFFQETGYSHD